MRVNVLMAADDGNRPPELLVLPYGPSARIPAHLRHLTWRNMATTTIDDRLLAIPSAKIETDIAINGFAMMKPEF